MKFLASKMVKVMAEVEGSVGKSGHNAHQKYDYVTEKDLIDAVRQALVNNKIHVFHSVVSSSREEGITTVNVEYNIVDADSGESYTVKSIGQGADKGDKGVYKAITGAYKYFVMKSFMVAGSDDPENDGAVKPQEKKETPVSKTPPGRFAKPAQEQNTTSKFGSKSGFGQASIVKTETAGLEDVQF